MNFEVHGSKSVNYENVVAQDLKPESKEPLAKLEFTYKEARKPSDTSSSVTGPVVRLVATFLTLGVSEDIHKKTKKTIVAKLSKALTHNARSKEDRQNSIEKFKESNHYDNATRLSVQVGEKTRLDGMLVKPLLVEKSEKYVIWLNGLGGDYEAKLTEACVYADTVHANILLFNYRGCGDSTAAGLVTPKDLVTDTLILHHPNDRMIRKSSLKNFLSKREITLENTEKSNHKIVNLSGGSDEQLDDAHNKFFKEFQGTAKHVAEFIHNKPFASIHSSQEETSWMQNESLDFENLGTDLGGFANFSRLSNRTTDSTNSGGFDFDIENLGDEEVLNLKPKPRNSEEI